MFKAENNDLGPAGARRLAERLEGLAGLTGTRLAVGGNQSDSSGGTRLAEALRGWRRLEALDLSGNTPGNEGVEALARALEGSAGLTSLKW